MKLYIITYRACDIEGKPYCDRDTYKYFLDKEKAEKAMKEAEEKAGWTKIDWRIEEAEIEE